MIAKLRALILTSKEKAVAGFLAGAIGSYLIQNGLTIKDVWSWHGVQALAVGVATHVFVYFTTNSK